MGKESLHVSGLTYKGRGGAETALDVVACDHGDNIRMLALAIRESAMPAPVSVCGWHDIDAERDDEPQHTIAQMLYRAQQAEELNGAILTMDRKAINSTQRKEAADALRDFLACSNLDALAKKLADCCAGAFGFSAAEAEYNIEQVQAEADKVTAAAEARAAAAEAHAADLAEKIAELRKALAENAAPEKVRHAVFSEALQIVRSGSALWLWGPAGTGKSRIAADIADELGAAYFEIGAVTDEYAGLKGFIDANGNPHGTQFTGALESAAIGRDTVLCIDEIDGSIPEVFICVNNFLAGEAVETCAGVFRNTENLHIIATANTNGRGGSAEYTRSRIDAASLDRFEFLRVDYDSRIEEACAIKAPQAAYICREIRSAAELAGVQLIVSYRGIKRVADGLDAGRNLDSVLESAIIKGLDAQTVQAIASNMVADAHDGYADAVAEARRALRAW